MVKIYHLIRVFFNLSSPEITNKITTFESFRLGEKELSSQRNRLEQMIDS